MAQEGAPTERRSDRKRAAIMAAATGLFLDHGYRGTSMDEVAAAAHVSKQTVYKHFGDKERLFNEIVTATVDGAGDRLLEEVARLADTRDLAADLHALGAQLLTGAMQPQVLRLRRLVIAEAGRFPDLGRRFLERGNDRTVQGLAAAFERLSRRAVLRLDDADTAAAQFTWLVTARAVNRAMILGRHEPPEPSEIAEIVAGAVRLFLAGYGTPAGASPTPG